ncbi:MAG: N-acetylmuramoyl-L-alanine amidase [Oscillospiraceae bacterium]|nr:N-acetylmuramoyl-L-alanine amidase [Oscillospiraceae bacterium]
MSYFKKYWIFYVFVCAAVLLSAALLSRLSSAIAVSSSQESAPVIVIDAGHGGEDGGAISVSGLRESGINLEISLRLNDVLRFLGARTRMIRREDVSVYTEGNTIAAKKVSDIKNRVAFVQNTPNAVLISIHQNQFSEEKYRGAQVFYAAGSEDLARRLQDALIAQVDSKNHRVCKPAKDIYLMEHVSCPAALIECGFLSNYAEEQLLRNPSYQKKLAAAIAGSLLTYLEDMNEV